MQQKVQGEHRAGQDDEGGEGRLAHKVLGHALPLGREQAEGARDGLVRG